MTSQPHTEDTYECDLPGCERTTLFEPDEEEWPPEPPPGWFSVVLARHDARNVNLMYCSQGHLSSGMRDHLPEPQAAVRDVGGWRDDVLGCTAVLGFVAVLLLGVVTAVVLLVDLVRWVLGGF